MLIEDLKTINGLTRLNPLDLFQFRPHGRSMRGYSLILVKNSHNESLSCWCLYSSSDHTVEQLTTCGCDGTEFGFF